MNMNLTNANWKAKVFSRENAVSCTINGILHIPQGVEYLDCDFAYFQTRSDMGLVDTVIIPESVKEIATMRGDSSSGPFGYRGNPFSCIIVDENNLQYCSQDGVLFSKDMSQLLCYPCSKIGKEYRIPKAVQTIVSEAFLNVEHLEVITVDGSLRSVEQGAFTACAHLDFPDLISVYKLCDKIIISFPVVKGCDYHPCNEKYYCFLTDTSLAKISERTFADYCSKGMLLIPDNDERHIIIQRFCSIIENLEFADLDWLMENEELTNDIMNFRNIFYKSW